jgi:hypothetical protein
MSESLTAIASPADSKSYDKGLKAKGEAEKVSSTEDGVSRPVSKYLGSLKSPKGAEAAKATTDSIAQDKQAGRYSSKPDLSDRRK